MLFSLLSYIKFGFQEGQWAKYFKVLRQIWRRLLRERTICNNKSKLQFSSNVILLCMNYFFMNSIGQFMEGLKNKHNKVDSFFMVTFMLANQGHFP